MSRNACAGFVWRVRRRLARILIPPPPTPVQPEPPPDWLTRNVVAGERTVFTPPSQYEHLPIRDQQPHLFVGTDCMIGSRFVFESNEATIRIGDRTYSSPGTVFTTRCGITVGSDVMISWQCQFIDHDGHSLDWRDRRADILQQNADYRGGKDFRTTKDWSRVPGKPIHIGDKVWIGFGSTVLKGVTIGEGAIIGAHTVVTRDIEPWTIVAGNPARVLRHIDEQS